MHRRLKINPGRRWTWGGRRAPLSWELRDAVSLARLMQGQDRAADAKVVLLPVDDRFTEGFDTADLIAAKRLLDELGDSRRN